MKTIAAILLSVLFLAGCTKTPVTYEQAQERFKIGMTPTEVKQVLGEPTDVSEEANETYWNYVPERKIQSGPKGSYLAFTIVFREGKATELLKHDIVKH